MELTQSRFGLMTSFLWTIITLTFRALMFPFILLGTAVLLRGLGLFQSPTVEDLRPIAAWLASADHSDLIASFQSLGISYGFAAFICLAAMWVVSPPSGKDWTRTMDAVILRLTRSAYLAISRCLPASLSKRWKRTIAVLALAMLPILILHVATRSTPQPAQPALHPVASKAAVQPQVSILMPDGTVLRGTAQVKPGTEPMTYVVTLTVHSK